MKELPATTQRELTSLSRAINAREETIQAKLRHAVIAINETLAEALLQGADLIKSKALCKSGDWQTWLAVSCPKLSGRRARRYMCLAAKAGNAEVAAELEEADSLRAALAICDMEGEETEATEPKRWPAYQEGVLRISKLRSFIDRNPIESWPAEGIEKAKAELEAIARLFWPAKFGRLDHATPEKKSIFF